MDNRSKRSNQFTPNRDKTKMSRLAPVDKSLEHLQSTISLLASKLPNEQLVKDLQESLDQHRSQLASFLQSIAMMETPEEKERKRSLVIIGLPEAELGDSIQRADSESVVSMLRTLEVEARPTQVYRMGKRSDDKTKPRLVKIVMPSSQLQRRCLGALKEKREALRKVEGFKKAIVRPSLTPEQLDIDRKLRAKLKEKRAENPKLKLYIKYGKICVDGDGGLSMDF